MTKDEDEHDLLNELHPLTTLLSFLVAKSDQDMIKLYQALQEPDAAEFIKAMEKGVSDYEVVLISTIPRRNKLILAVWSMKHKWDTGGKIIKCKALLCTHGGVQTNGVHYWETYLPIVSWTTVCLVLILSLIMSWHMRSLYFVMANP